MYKFIAICMVVAAKAARIQRGSPVTVNVNSDVRGGSVKNIEGLWKQSFAGLNLAAKYDRNKNRDSLHKLSVGRNLFNDDGNSLDATATYNFECEAFDIECIAKSKDVNVKVNHDTGDQVTSVEASFENEDGAVSAEFDSTDGLKAVELGRDFEIDGKNLYVQPRFETAGRQLMSKLRYNFDRNRHVQADLTYGLDDKVTKATAEYSTDLDNGDQLTVKLTPEEKKLVAILATKLGGGADDPSWTVEAETDYSKGGKSILDNLSVSAKRSWSF